MKINNTIFKAYEDKEGKLHPYDDSHVLLKKSMPADDKHLEEYLANIKKAITNGVNTINIIDYKLYEDQKWVYDKDHVFTTGLFLEEKAKGNSMNFQSLFILDNEVNVDYEGMSVEYIKVVTSYIKELELRANASQDIYDKFVHDCLEVENYDLTIDPVPANFFFDKEKGFTLIDLVPGPNKDTKREHFVEHLVSAIMGYGKPMILIGRYRVDQLPKELHNRYEIVLSDICAKLSQALINNKLDNLVKDVNPCVNKISFNNEECIEIEELVSHIADTFKKYQNYLRKEEGRSISF